MKGTTGEQLCWRTGKRVALWTIVANLDGAAFTFFYLAFLVPQRQEGQGSMWLDLVMLAVLLAVSIAVIGRRIDSELRRDLAWVIEERPPTDDERDATLAMPFRLSALPLVAWLVAAVLWGVCGLVLDLTVGEAVHVAVSIVLGGLVTGLIAYLLNERQCRPLFVLALADGGRPTRPTSPGVRARLVLTWALVSGVPLLALFGLPLHGDGRDIGVAVAVLSVLALVGGGLSTLIVAKAVAEPLADVRRALAAVEAGDLSVEVAVDDGGEVGMLQTGVNRMVAGLRERARLADLFGRHVGTEVAQQALEQGTGLQSEQREASALFVDLIGSTAMAEVLPPGDVVDTLNAYFATVVQVVGSEGGWVNKFEGDGALCVFGAPATQPDHAARALRAARRLHDELRRLSATHPGVDAAIGVSSGTVVAGNVGTESRYEYTVIGRPVNEAARLTELAKERPSRVLASGDALARAGSEAARWADLGTVALRGQLAPTTVAEPASGDRLAAS